MGLISWYANRRAQKESARTTAVEAGAGSLGFNEVHSMNGLAGVGALISQWQQFQQAGGAQMIQQQMGTQVFDMRGSGMRDEIMAAMQKHGVQTSGSQVYGFTGAINQDPNDLMALQGDILGVLQKHGINLSQMGVGIAPGMQPATPTDAKDLPPIQNPLGPS